MDRDAFPVPLIPPHGAAGGRARYLLSNAKKMNSSRKSDTQSASVSHKEGFPACQDRNPITARLIRSQETVSPSFLILLLNMQNPISFALN